MKLLKMRPLFFPCSSNGGICGGDNLLHQCCSGSKCVNKSCVPVNTQNAAVQDTNLAGVVDSSLEAYNMLLPDGYTTMSGAWGFA